MQLRVWLDLLLYTGLRRGDAVRFGRQHVRDGVGTVVKTEKSGFTVTGSRKFIAWCKRVNVEPHVLSYQWGDAYGEQVKRHLRAVHSVLQARHPEVVQDEAAYDSACAGESVGNDRLTLLAQLEGDDERWSAQLHAPP